MIQKMEVERLICDGCNDNVASKDAFMYSGRYNETVVEREGMHICPQCALELLDKYLFAAMGSEKIREYLGRIGSNGGGTPVTTMPYGIGITQDPGSGQFVDRALQVNNGQDIFGFHHSALEVEEIT